MEDGLGLTTVTGLLVHVTTLSLDYLRVLALLVLGDLVGTTDAASVQPFAEIPSKRATYVCFLQVLPLQSVRPEITYDQFLPSSEIP